MKMKGDIGGYSASSGRAVMHIYLHKGFLFFMKQHSV